MRTFLALDVGNRRTGVAFSSGATGVAVALATLHHSSYEEFRSQVLSLLAQRSVSDLIVGLPLLLSGEEGEQARTVRSFVERLPVPSHITLHFLDERYSTPPSSSGHSDPDSASACAILDTHLRRESI
ncbi:MAG: Holliday junction resolvase RuvX [Candidatus Peribacteraceae bacterium]|nr:Holliday junction resolvase RuvX [Candidatus Peribacteraceae bacterium]